MLVLTSSKVEQVVPWGRRQEEMGRPWPTASTRKLLLSSSFPSARGHKVWPATILRKVTKTGRPWLYSVQALMGHHKNAWAWCIVLCWFNEICGWNCVFTFSKSFLRSHCQRRKNKLKTINCACLVRPGHPRIWDLQRQLERERESLRWLSAFSQLHSRPRHAWTCILSWGTWPCLAFFLPI